MHLLIYLFNILFFTFLCQSMISSPVKKIFEEEVDRDEQLITKADQCVLKLKNTREEKCQLRKRLQLQLNEVTKIIDNLDNQIETKEQFIVNKKQTNKCKYNLIGFYPYTFIYI